VPFSKALSVFTKWGTGAGDFVLAMQSGRTPSIAKSQA
jgi:hypothetical protein